MSKAPYTKPALNYIAQLQQLKNRGLIVDNEPKALHLLEVVSYYRMSGYWYPLLADKVNHTFKAGATFDTAFNIYKFDRELRLLVMRELEKIEIAVRAKMIYILSHSRGSFWYQDTKNFSRPLKHPFLKQTTYTCPSTGNTLPLNNKVYFILSMILFFMNKINSKHNIQVKFKTLLAKYPNIDVSAMGFPAEWEKECLWK